MTSPVETIGFLSIETCIDNEKKTPFPIGVHPGLTMDREFSYSETFTY